MGMLELSMATMYKDAMSKAIEADFEATVRDYYAKSINMGKQWNMLLQERNNALRLKDHYREEGKRQNALAKETLARAKGAKAHAKDLQEQLKKSEEQTMNLKELYKLVTDEVSEAIKHQKALEREVEHTEAQ